jgi:hypothetical protein
MSAKAMRASDMLVHVQTRKLACVLDPALILATPGGMKLALRLTQVVEPWLTRTFWQLIDSSEWLRGDLTCDGAVAGVLPQRGVLEAWIAMREQTDAASWPFRWIGDRLADSQLLDHADAGLIELYESLADSLATRVELHKRGRLDDWPGPWDPAGASIDTLPLSAALDAAIILTAHDGRAQPATEPALVRMLRQLRISVDAADNAASESLFGAERSLMRETLAQAGAAVLCQDLPRLAIVHVMTERWHPVAEYASRADDFPTSDTWSQARAWWYVL